MSLLSSPPEVITHILQSCNDFSHLFSCITTCKQLYSIWKENSGSIIEAIGIRSIVAFEDALAASRAVEVVKRAIVAGRLPPSPFPLSEVKGMTKKPNLHELAHIQDLEHLALCIEAMIFKWNTIKVGPFRHNWEFFDEDLRSEPDWGANLHRAIYRNILAGAVFSRPYSEPLAVALDQGNVQIINELANRGGFSGPDMTEETFEFLGQFPMYNFEGGKFSEEEKWRYAEYEKVFGQLANCIVDESKERGRTLHLPDGTPFPDDRKPISELIQMLAAYQHLVSKIVNRDTSWYLNRPHIQNTGCDRYRSPHIFPGRVRQATVVLFGGFHLEVISMPSNLEDTADLFLLAHPYGEDGSSYRYNHDRNITRTSLTSIVNWLPWTGPSNSPAELHFFRFVLHKFFNRRFSDEAFKTTLGVGIEPMNIPFRLLANAKIFRNGEIGEMIIEDYDHLGPSWV